MEDVDLSETQSGITVARFSQPSIEFARLVQVIGHDAWSYRMEPYRTDHEVRHMFDPGSEENAEKLLASMKSKVGQFVGVLALAEDQPIGCAWAADDVGNMSRAAQRVKTEIGALTGKKPIVWTALIDVMRDHQNQGYGNVLLDRVLEPFDPEKRTSAYVFDENQLTLGWFRRRTYEAIPDKPSDPNGRPDGPDRYFGLGARHVSQWRLESATVSGVRENLALHPMPEHELVEEIAA